MPTTPKPSREVLAATLVALYVLAERQLLTGIAAILRRTLPTLEGRQAAVPRIRRLTRQVHGRLASQSSPLIENLIDAAIVEGRMDADDDHLNASIRLTPLGVPELGGGGQGGTGGRDLVPYGAADDFDFSMRHGERSARAIRADLESELQDVRFRITRLPDDIYKAIAPHGAIGQVIDNGFTPAQAQAVAWRVFMSQGITGFTDKSGRDWALSSYVEMAVRTATTRAYNASHLARMHALGIHYFSVPTSLHPCPLCFPWQSKVLTDGYVTNPEIHVDATIAEATAAGLWHPNCEHTLIPVIPGVTVLPEVGEWTDELEQAYRDSQTQRRLEREVRKAKRILEHAIDPKVRADAVKDVRRAQKRVREYVRLKDFTRQSRREQLDLTDPRIKLPTPIR